MELLRFFFLICIHEQVVPKLMYTLYSCKQVICAVVVGGF